MSSIKLLNTLSILNAKQEKRLLLFVQSPYHNQFYNADQLVELLEHILQSPSVDKIVLQIHFFPEKPFREKQKNAIDNLLSDLHRLVQDFIVYEEFKGEAKAQREWALTSFYSRNSHEELIWPLISKYRLKWEKIREINFIDLYRRFQIEELASKFGLMFKTKQDKKKLNNELWFLEQAFLMKKMEIGFFTSYEENILGKQKLSKTDILFEYIMEHYDQLSTIHTPLSDAYFYGIKVCQNIDKVELLENFEETLNKNQKLISAENLRNLYTCYRSFIGLQYKKKGKISLIPKLLSMYKDHLEKGFLAIDGKLYDKSLKLLINIGLKGEDFDWVEKILTDYPPKRIIGTRYPKDFHSLCTAELLFAKKAYKEAESQIVYRLFEDNKYSLNCDILLVKIYVETQSDLLESRIRALELKIRRAKLSAFDKKAYLNFISILRKIDKYLFLKDQKKIDKVKEVVQSSKPMIQREWLMELLA